MSVELVIATFEQSETQAVKTLNRVVELAEEGSLVLEDAAAIVRTEDGEFEVTDVKDVAPKKGAVYGAVTGALVGLLGGPVGAVAGAIAGAAAGGGITKLTDLGVSDKMIHDVEKGLQPGSSALVVYAQLSWVDKAVSLLEKAGGTVSHTTMALGDLTDLV
jgi:uncharacterized membrane protein